MKINRTGDILRIIAKYGFQEFVDAAPDRLPLESNPDLADLSKPRRLKLLLQELGPTFTKFGQVLATRVDLLPQEYLEALSELQDDVEPVSYDEIGDVLRGALGQKMADAFMTIEEAPLATASIAQVHRAVLQDGTKVVLKVRKPGVREMIESPSAPVSAVHLHHGEDALHHGGMGE